MMQTNMLSSVCQATETTLHGFFFFIGDEGYYPKLDNQPTEPIFKALTEKFDTFFIHWPYQQDIIADRRIVSDWKKILGERLIILKEPKAIVDVMLGLIAMRTGSMGLDHYARDMKKRGQSDSRIETVIGAIEVVETEAIEIYQSKSPAKTISGLLPNRDPFRQRKSW